MKEQVIREAVMIDAYLREPVREAASLSKHPGSMVIALTWALGRIIHNDVDGAALVDLVIHHLQEERP